MAKRKPKLKVGDLVYQCEKWIPGMETEPPRGLGLVTMIADEKMRVIWRNGEILWFPENKLVHISNIVKLRR